MKQEKVLVSLLLWVLLAVAQITPTAAQAQGLTLTWRTDQATYQVGSQATVTLILRSTMPMTGETGWDALGCDWNIVILDAGGTGVFDSRLGFGKEFGEEFDCPEVLAFRNVPPPLVKRATIPLQNNLHGGDPLPPGLYTVRAILEWFRTSGAGTPGSRLGPQSAEVVIEITE